MGFRVRLRLGVALMVPAPLSIEIDGLRRALDDPARERIAPHITLVPPVNVGEEQVPDALEVMRAAAAKSRPITVGLGPPTTFLPDNPVVYLPVVDREGPEPHAAGATADGQRTSPGGVGPGTAAVSRLRDGLWLPPLSRPLDRPFVAHVTIAADATPDRIASARLSMAGFAATVRFDCVHLLVETPGRVWVSLGEAALGPPAIVGRGGLPLELSRTEVPDLAAATFLAERRRHVTITARRDGQVAGVLQGWCTSHPATVSREADHREPVRHLAQDHTTGSRDRAARAVSDCVVDKVEVDLGTEDHLRAAFESWANEQ